MSSIKIKSLKIKNYRSFGNDEQEFDFTKATEKNLPLAIVGYNNAGKTNLMNGLKYSLYESVKEDTFELSDFFDLKWSNPPSFESWFVSSGLGDDKIRDNQNYRNTVKIEIEKEKIKDVVDGCNASSFNGKEFSKKWTIKQSNLIFYINFHKIKEEISTQKTSWGNLKSFLAKHIKKLVDEDENMKSRKGVFKDDVKNATNKVLNGEEGETKSKLIEFVEKIKNNYSTNLRDNNCEVEFGLPDYEDIFLQMIFKIGLNGKTDKLVPIDHFGDGYISMFVMAVIQAIAEERTEDKCLFLFEEPESFLHENHQEYFYKMVLCDLAEKGHQVIYTTHSDKMVDITKPDSLIRLKFDGNQTLKTFPVDGLTNPLEKPEDQEIIKQYNQYIKNIEPNLNKILFSEKVLLVEGPNDLLVYGYLIKLKARDKANTEEKIKDKRDPEKQKWAETYLNFNNMAIIPHHGKATAYILANLCQYLGVDYYLINDWDFESSDLDLNIVTSLQSENELKENDIYKSQTDTKKGMITTNWKLIKSAKDNQIHFNVKRLEDIIDYQSNNKDALKIWQTIQAKFPTVGEIEKNVFPDTLDKFLFPIKIKKDQENQMDQVKTELQASEPQNLDVDSMNVEMPF